MPTQVRTLSPAFLKMVETKKNPFTKWEVSIMELETERGKEYKVTRKITDLSVSETKIFKSKEEAKKQFEEWLN